MGSERRQRWGVSGQGMVEYGLLVFLVSVTVMAIMFLLADQFGSIFSNSLNSI
jgi:Flp pilus assembly pilin Flp